MARPRTRPGISTTDQRTICWHLATGATQVEAARLSGFPDARRLTDFQRTKEFAVELRQAIQDRLSLDLAPKAVAALNAIVSDEKINPKIRLDAAKAILDRAGHATGEATKNEAPVDSGMEEWPIEKLQAYIAAEQNRRAANAVDVTPVEVAPSDTATADLGMFE